MVAGGDVHGHGDLYAGDGDGDFDDDSACDEVVYDDSAGDVQLHLLLPRLVCHLPRQPGRMARSSPRAIPVRKSLHNIDRAWIHVLT